MKQTTNTLETCGNRNPSLQRQPGNFLNENSMKGLQPTSILIASTEPMAEKPGTV